MNVMMADVEDSALAAAVHGLSNYGDRVASVRCDVAIGEELPPPRRAHSRRSATSISCNNAGVSRAGHVEEITVSDWDWVIGVNLYGLIHGLRAFLPHMKAHGEPGHIVNTSSMSGLTPKALAGPYGATKFAIVGLSHVLADELAGTKIGVSVLCPGWTRTNMPDNGRNRPARFGGAYDFRADPLLAERNKQYVEAAQRADPPDLAALVLCAIEENEFYIITQPNRRRDVEARYEELPESRRAGRARRILKRVACDGHRQTRLPSTLRPRADNVRNRNHPPSGRPHQQGVPRRSGPLVVCCTVRNGFAAAIRSSPSAKRHTVVALLALGFR
jgi:NAD(P)-dependent dehydrogenase (short-subunit alcohol dehydrogenase family)